MLHQGAAVAAAQVVDVVGLLPGVAVHPAEQRQALDGAIEARAGHAVLIRAGQLAADEGTGDPDV